MDNFDYININTFEIFDECPDYIHCDKEIVEIIAILNKKGYKTIASCAGHNSIEYFRQEFSENIDKLEEIKNNFCKKILRIEDEKIYYLKEIIGTSTYIAFKEIYKFPNIPEGFEILDNNISKLLFYYDKDSVYRRSDKEIEEEIENNLNVLKAWALELEENNIN